MEREQILELENTKAGLLRQTYRMRIEHPHMSPVSLEQEMYTALMLEIEQITKQLQLVQARE